MLLVACYKQHGTIHDATLLKATVACYKVASCMMATMSNHVPVCTTELFL